MKKIAIIPANNEESTIEEIIKGTSLFVDEIPVIYDGSTDRTADNAKAGAIVVDKIVNRGLGKTIQHVYDEAPIRDADIVVRIDTDGQYPKEIPRLILHKLENRVGLVLGLRLDNLKYKMPWVKIQETKHFPDSFPA